MHLLTSDSDGNISDATLNETWTPISWKGHSASCVALDVIVTPDGELVLVTVGEEGIIKLWKLEQEWVLIASTEIVCGHGGREVLPECIAAFPFAPGVTLVALGGTDPGIQIYLHSSTDFSFRSVLRGHRDWIRGLAFHQADSSVLLASASTDSTARIWRITDTLEESATLALTLPDKALSFTKQALLDEHTKAVHTVSFCDGHLLTASMDCSVAVWVPSDQTHCVARFGLMGGASAHALGFFGAAFTASDASHILAHNFSGALHRWRLTDKSDMSYQYVAHPAPTGHFAPVSDIAWSPRGDFLLSCSTDKTTRIFAEVDGTFVEWARPQVHGHSVFTVAFCDESGRKYVSGAEERMLRLFEAPVSFQMPGIDAEDRDGEQPLGASMPQLGLSNKPVFAENKKEDASNTRDPVSSFGVDRAKSSVPLEEDLNQHRLWPETAKLYGHGNEISCVAVDVKNGVLASACRAQTGKDAVIILWDIFNGVECARLFSHDLTINQMRFTEDGTALLSVSKDRSFSICRRGDARFSFTVSLRRRTAHTRLLYCCSWIKDGLILATGSRDKCIKLFSVSASAEGANGLEVQKYKFDSAVTAMDCFKRGSKVFLAAGFESGNICVFNSKVDGNNTTLNQLVQCKSALSCGLRVSSLQWRPWQDHEKENDRDYQIAIGSEDCSVRVYSFQFAY